jgi:hypothetical protein
MRRTIEKLIARHNATAVATRVKSLAYDGANWRVQLIDGSIVSARRIILAAGVLGTAGLLMRSFPEVSSVRLRDHAPWMLYTRGWQYRVFIFCSLGRRHLVARTDDSAVLWLKGHIF